MYSALFPDFDVAIMQSFLVALIATAIATQTGAVPRLSAAVLDEGAVSVDLEAVVPTPTVAIALPTPKIVKVQLKHMCKARHSY